MAVQIDNAYRVSLFFTLSDVFFAMTHFDFVQGTAFSMTQTNCNDLVGDIGGAITAGNVNDAWSTDVKVPLWRVHSFHNPLLADIDVTSELTGAEGGQLLPPNVTLASPCALAWQGRHSVGASTGPGTRNPPAWGRS